MITSRNKILFQAVCLLFSLLFGIWSIVDGKTNFAFYQVIPVDEGKNNPDFKAFRDNLFKAIAAKDVKFLLEHTDPNIQFDFGLPEGIVEFKKEWGLNKGSKKSKLWAELKAVLELGGVFDEDGSFWAPYTFSRFPDDLDGYSFYAALGNKVGLYSKPSINSSLLKTLSFEVVLYLEEIKGKENGKLVSWTKVQTSSGAIGYVKSIQLRSPIDYRVGFIKENDRWMMKYFIAGD